MIQQPYIGETFGRLTVTTVGLKHGYHKAARVVCTCGTVKVVASSSLRAGLRSCGCLRAELLAERKTIHGNSREGETKEYRAWKNIKQRCNNPKNDRYDSYGGRGITYDPAWEAFPPFLEHIGAAPSPSHSVDRINTELGYTPGNVRWATQQEQLENKRNSVRYAYKDQLYTITQLAILSGVNSKLIRWRLNTAKMSVEDSVNPHKGLKSVKPKGSTRVYTYPSDDNNRTYHGSK